ncbi:YugE family protein [Planococcus sp. MERTA32b]|nr:YugE family protein [Planococcus sp. MER TA 32b]
MVTEETNKQAGIILEEWDPFALGGGKYIDEISGVIEQLQLLDDPSGLAKQIQSIYQISFGSWIPLEKCVAVSYKLLALKFEAKNII